MEGKERSGLCNNGPRFSIIWIEPYNSGQSQWAPNGSQKLAINTHILLHRNCNFFKSSFDHSEILTLSGPKRTPVLGVGCAKSHFHTFCIFLKKLVTATMDTRLRHVGRSSFPRVLTSIRFGNNGRGLSSRKFSRFLLSSVDHSGSPRKSKLIS
jgi:hypothetical protein